MKRKGSAIATAIILGTVFFIAVSALLHYSSSEMRHIKAISAVKKAELLALSGIDWAESQLRVKRWYGTEFVPYKHNKGKHDSYGTQYLTPFGEDEGSVTIICEDVANKTPGYNMYGMQKIWFLHHINVYALGEYENQKCLVYGRYIISPEPILNSTSTEGAGFESPQYGAPGAVGVSAIKTIVNGKEVTNFVVKEIKVAEHDNVNINTVVAIVNPIDDPDRNIEVRPTTFGTVAEIKAKKGQTCRAGDNLLILSKSIDAGGTSVSMKTLKKMVRVTKIPPEIWKDLDIDLINDRFAISQYISGISDAYLQNFVAHASLEKSLKNIGDEKFDNKLSASEVLSKFPVNFTSTTRNRAENTFIAYMIKNFTAPGGTWDRKEKALDETFLKLDHERTEPPQEYLDWLDNLGLTQILNTKPRLNSKYFDPKMKNDEFMNLLHPHLNQPSSEFIANLSQLPDASRFVNIQEGDFSDESPSYIENENGIHIIDPDKGVKVDVQKITKKYTFVDPESNFAIEMTDLLSFIKKYYDDDGSLPPREETRTNEFIDWPLPAPAPEPPPPAPGGNWVWIDGKPGTPPGDPTYHHRGGTDENINPPTGGTGRYEPDMPDDLDGGSKDWEIEGSPYKDGKDGGEDSDKDSGERESVKICNCNKGNCGICNPSGEKEQFTINKNTKWDVTPGTPGKDPEQGKYVWEPSRNDPSDGSDGSPGNDGNADGGADSTDDATGGSGETDSTPGSGNYVPSDPGPSAPSTPSTPAPSYRSGSFGF